MAPMPQDAAASDAAPQVRDLPVQMRELQLVPDSFNAEDNTVEVIWTTGAKVRRYDYWNDTPYEEELVVSPDAVDMSRFEAGAVSVLDGHRQWGGVRAVIGIVTRAWLDGGVGRAVLKMSKRDELKDIVADIAAGIIRNISVGYSVLRYEITRAVDRTDGVAMPLYRAALWMPAELSFVPVGADMDSGTRSADASAPGHQVRSQGAVPCEFIRAFAPTSQEQSMGTETKAPGGDVASSGQQQQQPQDQQRQAPAPDVAAERQAADQAAVKRSADITDLCVKHGLGKLAGDLIRSGKTVQQAGLAILEERALEDARSGGHRNSSGVQKVGDEQETRLRGMEEALQHRVDPAAKITDNGRQFRGMSLIELGRDYLEANGVNTRGMARMDLASRMLSYRSGGMHSTSDFAFLLANVASKRLRQAYEENPGTYKRWARRAPNAPDFKTMSVVQMSAMPDLLKVNEHGEFKYGALKDGAETYALLTYGRIVPLTRQAIVNDDLRAFDRINTGFGSSAARLENRTVYAQLTSNPALSDTVVLFHATHGNLDTGAGSALQFSSLSTMRKNMRLQKGLQSEELNLVPVGIIVPAALEGTAYQLTSSNYTPATKGEVNEFRQGGRTAVEPIVEPILDANSATAWYGFASNMQVDTVEFCYLDGAEGPVLDSEVGFDVDGLSLKARLDFAAKVLDHRGLHKSNGA